MDIKASCIDCPFVNEALERIAVAEQLAVVDGMDNQERDEIIASTEVRISYLQKNCHQGPLIHKRLGGQAVCGSTQLRPTRRAGNLFETEGAGNG